MRDTALGFLVTLYATLITLFGLAWVLFLIGTCFEIFFNFRLAQNTNLFPQVGSTLGTGSLI